MPAQEKIRVYLSHPLWRRIMAITRATTKEVGGAMTVDTLPDGSLRITDLVGIKQITTRGDVDFDENTFKDFLVSKGWWDEPMPVATWGIWHSHNTMQVFESATDKAMIARMVSRGFLVNLIVNHKGEVTCLVDTLIGTSREEKDYVRVRIPSELVVDKAEPDEMDAFAKAYLEAYVSDPPAGTSKGVTVIDRKDAPSGFRPRLTKKERRRLRRVGALDGPMDETNTAGGADSSAYRFAFIEDGLFKGNDDYYYALPSGPGNRFKNLGTKSLLEARKILEDLRSSGLLESGLLSDPGDDVPLSPEETRAYAREIMSRLWVSTQHIVQQAQHLNLREPGDTLSDVVVKWWESLTDEEQEKHLKGKVLVGPTREAANA